MSYLWKLIRFLGCLSLFGMGASVAASAVAQSAIWQHHQDSMYYVGMTSAYTCDGLKEKARQMLLYFGARADLKLSASCYHLIRPMEQVVVHVDFYTLAPADSSSPGAVSGQWVLRMLRPRQPWFMGMGECDFVRQAKGMLTRNFSLRDLRYDTSCMAHDITIEDYRVSGQVLEQTDLH